MPDYNIYLADTIYLQTFDHCVYHSLTVYFHQRLRNLKGQRPHSYSCARSHDNGSLYFVYLIIHFLSTPKRGFASSL